MALTNERATSQQPMCMCYACAEHPQRLFSFIPFFHMCRCIHLGTCHHTLRKLLINFQYLKTGLHLTVIDHMQPMLPDAKFQSHPAAMVALHAFPETCPTAEFESH
jgi:hypothetical protein